MTPPRESDTERLASIVGDEQAIMAYVGELSTRLADAEEELEALRRVELQAYPWRVGRKVGRTIYAQLGCLPSDNDALIGVMDTVALARTAVEAHNARMDGPATNDEPT